VAKVAIVILNYNGGQLLHDCVKSFLTLHYEAYRLFVVDNASTDHSIDGLEDLGPQVEVIRSEENLGYTGGNNLGMQTALDQGYDYVLLVNNDTIVHNPDFITQMVDFTASTDDAGIVGPKVFFRTTDVVQNTICATPFFLRALASWPLQKLRPKETNRSGDQTKEVDVLNGVCILLKAEMLRKIGLLDPLIFMYREDTDIAIRARRLGWKSYYVPYESIVHLQKSVGYEYNSMVNFLLKRNAVYVLKKHGYWLNALGQAISSVILSSARAIRASLKNGDQSHWTFVQLLYRAHLAVFSDKLQSDAFGPPLASWKQMLNADQSRN
jgi:GT2 family glycosyltransferase